MTPCKRSIYVSRVFVCYMIALTLAGTPLARQQENQTDVPPVPSPPEVVTEIIRLAALNKESVLVDLGCGDGRIVIAAAKARARAVCVEIDGYMLQQAREAAQKAGLDGQIEFRQQDLRDYVKDNKALAAIDVVVLYLTPELNRQIATDLRRNLKRGTKVISHAYPVYPWRPNEIKPVRIKATGNTSRIYIYELPGRSR